ncbi:MAG TPA: hypothetical protein VHI11_00210 [Jiangellaceae bacterium]|nr:hypothetical protein [Jiangellaceae bacterium]
MSEANEADRVRRRVRGRPPSAGRVVVETITVCIAAGLLVGLVWWLIAPQFAVEMVDGELQPAGPMGESRFAADAWFAIISGAAGVLIAVVMFTRHRHRPIATVIALAAAGLAGSVVAWRLGMLLRPDRVTGALGDIAEGTRLDFPLDLGATGVLFAWPIASLATVMLWCLLGNEQSRWRPARRAADFSLADRSGPWSLP